MLSWRWVHAHVLHSTDTIARTTDGRVWFVGIIETFLVIVTSVLAAVYLPLDYTGVLTDYAIAEVSHTHEEINMYLLPRCLPSITNAGRVPHSLPSLLRVVKCQLLSQYDETFCAAVFSFLFS